jgi:hypothetical protein
VTTDDPGAPAPGTITGFRRVAIGCFTTVLGFMSGAMVAVLLSTVVAFATRAPVCPDVPTCNWYVYAGIGGLIGAISLPSLVLWTISRPKKTT